MVNKELFNSSKGIKTDTVNEAGGCAYAMTTKHALAQYVCAGTFNGTYYATAEDQLKNVLELASKVEPEFIAKCALYARERSFMKDMPAFLCAYLVTQGRTDLVSKIFDRVIDSPKMLRNFVQFLRSGAVERKSLGSASKKLVQKWLESHSESSLFRGSVGNTPSLADVIKMAHPKPSTPERDALYKYLLKKECDVSKLPAEVQAFEIFKKNPEGDVPGVPFEMLTALSLNDKQWVQLAKNASWTQTRMNLQTFHRHGVFKEPGMDSMIAKKLADINLIKKAKVFPYQLMAAYLNVDSVLPSTVINALQDAMEIAVDNISTFGKKVYVLPDVSGSMSSSVTGVRKGATSKVTCQDVAALFSAAILRRNQDADVIPFGDHVCNIRLNPKDSIMTNAKVLRSTYGGGTNCAAPLAELNRCQAKGDLIIYISDNQSWLGSSYSYSGTLTLKEWKIFKARNPSAKLVCIDIQPYGTVQAPDSADILNVGGFSDQVFDVVEAFSSSGGKDHWTEVIEKIAL